MKTIFTILLFLLSSTLFSQNFLTTKGRNIVTPDGEPILLRGVNLSFWLEPEGYPFEFDHRFPIRRFYDIIADLIGPDDARKFWEAYQQTFITKADIAYIKSRGLNSVRIPFDYRIMVDECFMGAAEPRGYKLLDKAIQWCREEGIYVILDMHAAPGGQAGWPTDDGYVYPWLFEDNGEESRLKTIDIWTSLAQRYANDTCVIGYDLLGEPIHQYIDTARFNKRLEPFYKRLVGEIRKVDTNHIVFLAGAFWSRNFDVFTKPFDSKVVYTTHLYSLTQDYCSVDYYADFSKKHNVPVWLGEFGEKDKALVDSIRTLCENNNIGWCAWPLKKLNNDHCLLKIDKPENWDQITAFTNGFYHEREAKIIAHPGWEVTGPAMEDFLENIKFENCTPSDYYKEALELK